MDYVPFKPRLVALLGRAWEEQHRLMVQLTEEQRARTGTMEHWAPRDHLAHVSAWRRHLADRLAAAARAETPPDTRDFDRLNVAIFQGAQGQTWDAVVTEAGESHQAVLERLATIPEDDLDDMFRFPWLEGAPLWQSVLGNGYWHVQEHLVKLAFSCGDADRATGIQVALTEYVDRLDLPDSIRGIARYNLACLYATTGRPEEALQVLPEGLRLYPALIDAVPNDPDFTSLHGIPAYEALITSRP